MESDTHEASARITTRITELGIQNILLQFTDIGGRCKGVSVPADRFSAVLEQGQWIDGSSIDSSVRLRENDMSLRPDPATFSVLRAEDGGEPLARVMCDVYGMDDKPFTGDPRHVLKRALEHARASGYHYYIAPEVEFYVCLLDASGRITPLNDDHDGYFDLSPDLGTGLRHKLVNLLRESGIAVESSHHEVASGQHEIDLSAADALTIADQLVTLKYLARRLAHQLNVRVTFMPKPFSGLSGSGLHLHQTLLRAPDGVALASEDSALVNVFGERSRRSVSPLGLQFIAGQLEHASALVALTSPLVNSYKRLASGYEAPATIAWAHESRSAFIRVPHSSVGHREATRIELRATDPACNPYLALAAMLRAGMSGIEHVLAAPEPVEEPVYPFEVSERIPLGARALPLTLGEALQPFSASELMRDALGEYVFGRYVEMKRREWRAFQTYVTDWEQDTSWETA